VLDYSLCYTFALVNLSQCSLFDFYVHSVLCSEYITHEYCMNRRVFYEPTKYYPHKRPELRDSAAQTLDRELQSAGPPILLTSVETSLGCRMRGLNLIHSNTK